MGIYYFPSNFVYWRKLPNHEIVKSKILSIIENNKSKLCDHNLVKDGNTTHYHDSFNQSILNENPDIVKSVVWDSIEEVLETLNSRNDSPSVNITKSKIDNMWMSQYDTNSTVEMHEHYSSTNCFDSEGNPYKSSFALIYIVNDPNEKNTTEFVQPYMMSTSVHGMAETHFDTSKKEDIGEGTVLVFPSSLYHKVNQMKKPGRVIMSFNIFSNIPEFE